MAALKWEAIVGGVTALGAVLGPVGIAIVAVIAVIAALAAVIYYFRDALNVAGNWDAFTSGAKSAWETVKSAFTKGFAAIAAAGRNDWSFLNPQGEAFDLLAQKAGAVWASSSRSPARPGGRSPMARRASGPRFWSCP
jgi:hypothetical protein